MWKNNCRDDEVKERKNAKSYDSGKVHLKKKEMLEK